MTTLTQILKGARTKKYHAHNSPALQKCPQKKGICRKYMIMKPKKPHSGQRKIARIELSTGRKVLCYVPGIIEAKLNEYAAVLVRGGRVPDLPGIQYHLIRGKYDFPGLTNRTTSRSKYGKKRILEKKD